MTTNFRRAIAFGVAGAMALATPAFAAPVLSSTASVKAAAADHAVDVRWRHGGGVAAGLAVGALAGAAIAAATAPRYGGYYDYPAYTYGYPAYGYPAYGAYGYPGYGAYGYDTGPVYRGAYAYPYRTCGAYGGYGRWDYSNC